MRSSWRQGCARAVVVATVAAASGVGCGDDEESCTHTFVETLDIGVCDPTAGPFSTTIDNELFPMAVGTVWVLEGEDDGETARVEVTVTDETESVAGVTTRVLVERESENGELVEISRNFFAQAPDGTVCYFGEDVDIYENDAVVSHDGAWRAGENGARPGIQMPASPSVGQAYRQEVAEGIARDEGTIAAAGEPITTPAGTYSDTLRVEETSALDACDHSTKVYARGIGMVFDSGISLVSYTPAP